jgi:two-component system sensor histidine kinase QseC
MAVRLLTGVLGAVAVVWLATAVLSYRDARRQIDELLDAHLAQAAALLVAQASHEIEEIVERTPKLHRYGQTVVFQVWERGVLRVRSAEAPTEQLSRELDGFSDAEVGGRRWRVFSTSARKQRLLIQVAEERAARERLAATIGTTMVTPMVLALPVLGLLVWLGVRWGTRPLGLLRAQVVERAPDNLVPLEVADAPAEVAPLIESLNRLLERLRASIEAERRFTADAAHELRTPIAALRAHAEVARAASTVAERQPALERLLLGCDRAARAVDQLLTLARIDPGEPVLRRLPCDLREVARDVLADQAPIALRRGVDVELGPGAPVVVPGDRGLLGILLRNLVDNAVRASPRGATARVDIGRNGAGVRVVVSDEGPGVPAAQRAALGRRFHRLSGSGEPGTGLGLSIVMRIAELHGGRVRFEDGPGGRGLSVVVELPAA